MLFNSFQFLIFLPCVVILYYLIPHRLRWVLLLAASYYFYMVFKPEYIILIITSTLIDYCVSIFMEKQKNKKAKKALLILSLFTNLGLLFVFKYFNFFNNELSKIYEFISSESYEFSGLNIILPMGISFYTFQTLSYTIDVYRGNRKAEKHFGYFALYVTYFPQLVAGPIERSDRLLPQLKQKSQVSYNDITDAILRICWGFFKKVMIADRVAVIANTIYSDLPSYTGIYMMIATVAFAIQIYCDFSAYSDIAIGSAKLMGVDLMENFKVPYLSKSIHEFWSRWHISLSTWFRDYLYIPLGGNRVDKKWKYYRNVLIVFIVSGFWHGAEWTFIIWGFLHGLYQISERLLFKGQKRSLLPNIIATPITFILVLFAWIFFRADNIGDAFYVVSNLGFSNINLLFDVKAILSLGLDYKDVIVLIVSVVMLMVSDYIKYKNDKQVLFKNCNIQQIISFVLAVIILIFGYYGESQAVQFIYFQF